MKRILLFLFLFCSLSLSAQEVDTTPHKHRFIELVNNGEFQEAVQELPLVEEWNLGVNKRDYLDVDKSLRFISLLDSIQVVKSDRDSFMLYLNDNFILYGNYSYYNGNFLEAVKYYLESLGIYKEVLGESHPDYATSLNSLGGLYSDLGNYPEAERYYLKSLLIRKEVLGENHPDYATSLNNLGMLYITQGNYPEAEKYFLKSLRILKEVFGENPLDYAAYLINLGSLYQTQANYIEAEKSYLESLGIYKEVIDENPLDYSTCLNNLGGLYSDLGNYSEAEKYYLESLRIRKEILDENHPDYANSLNNLGGLYSDLGNYSEAEKYYLESLRIRKKKLGEKHPDYAISLNNLGSLYSDLGNYSEAERYYLESLRICKEVLEKPHPNYAMSLNNLGSLYSDLENYSEAERYYLESLRICKEVLGKKHPDYAVIVNNVGGLYEELENYSEAEKYLLESLLIFKDVLGENHPDYAISLNNLGSLYSDLGNYPEAERYYLESLRKIKEVLGENHINYAINLGNLGLFYSNLGNYPESEKYFEKSKNVWKSNYLVSLNYMTDYERMLLWQVFRIPFEYAYPLFTYRYHFTKPSISTFAYDNELFRKGLLLNSADAVRRSILESGDSALIKQWNELTEAKQVVMHLEEKEPTSSQLEIYRHRADSLEKQITISSAAFRESKEQWKINWESVKKQLSKNEVAIEYFSAPISQDSTMYCALLLRHNSKYPELIPLFEGKEVTDIMSTINESIDNSLLYNYNKYGAILSEKVWSKILPRVKEGETIYFSPSGLLHQLAIEFLPVDSVRTMSDVYNMVRLSSTRELALNKKQTSNTRATVYGGIPYTLDKETMQTESRRYASQERSIDADKLNRGTVIDLPATLVEAKYIDSLLVANNITTTLFTSEKANEESFKALSGKGNRILHIATHGFTWTDSVARKQDYFASRIQMIGDNLPKGPVIDPLNRCGLLFAGANTAYQGRSKDLPGGVQDGILTAKEISLMDLRGTELVVLSACETAQGDITSEGVFGLQRAFKMAGVQTIIMSLWKVDDKATKMFMSEFYKNWIEKKQSKREAFNNAKNTVRYAVNEFGNYIYKDKPYYWAGFIMLD